MEYERFKTILENEVIPLLNLSNKPLLDELYFELENAKIQIDDLKKYPMAISILFRGKEYIIILYPTSHEVVVKKSRIKRYIDIKIKTRHSAMLSGKYRERYKKLVVGNVRKLKDKIVKENYFKESKPLWRSFIGTFYSARYIGIEIVEESENFAMVILRSSLIFDDVFVFTPLGILFSIYTTRKEKVARYISERLFKGDEQMENVALKLLSGEIDLNEFKAEEEMFKLFSTL